MAPNNTINARIALEGGADIARAFADIRDAATSALQQMQAAFARLNLQIPGIEQAKSGLAGVGETGKQAAGEIKTAFDSVGASVTQAANSAQSAVTSAQGSLNSLRQAADQSNASLIKTGALLGGGFALGKTAVDGVISVGKSIGGLSRDFGDTADELADNAKAASLTTEAYQRLKTHADEGGVSAKNFSGILGDLNRLSKEFANGGAIDLGGGITSVSKKAGDGVVTILRMGASAETAGVAFSASAQTLQKYGISLNQVVGKGGPEEFLQVLAERYNQLGSDTQKAAFAQDFFGARAKDATGLLKLNADGLKKSSEDAREFSAQELKAGTDLKKAVTDLSDASSFALGKIGAILAPQQTVKVEWLTNLIDGARKLVDEFLQVSGIKDKLLSGEANPFKDIDFDKLGAFLREKGQNGLATALEFLTNVSKDLASIWDNVLVPAGTALLDAFNAVAAKINETFGTDISGRFLIVAGAVAVVASRVFDLGSALAPVSGVLSALLGPLGFLAPALLAVGGAFALAFTKGVPAIDTLKDKLKSVGIDVDAIKGRVETFLSGAWDDLVAAVQGRRGDIKSGFVGDMVDFLKSTPGIILEVVAGLAVLRRAAGTAGSLLAPLFGRKLSGDAVIAGGAILQFSGALDALAHVATIAGAGLVGVVATLNVLEKGLVGLATLIGTTGAAWVFFAGLGLLVAGNYEKVDAILKAVGIDIGAIIQKIDDGLEKDFGFRPLQALLGSLGGQLKQMQKDVDDFAREFAEKGLIAALLQDLEKSAPQLAQALRAIVDEFKNNGLVPALLLLGEKFNQAVLDFLVNLTKGFQDFNWSDVWSGLVKSFDKALDDLKARVRNLPKSILEGILGVTPAQGAELPAGNAGLDQAAKVLEVEQKIVDTQKEGAQLATQAPAGFDKVVAAFESLAPAVAKTKDAQGELQSLREEIEAFKKGEGDIENLRTAIHNLDAEIVEGAPAEAKLEALRAALDKVMQPFASGSADQINAVFADLRKSVDLTSLDTFAALTKLKSALDGLASGKVSIDVVREALKALDAEIDEGSAAETKLEKLGEVLDNIGPGTKSAAASSPAASVAATAAQTRDVFDQSVKAASAYNNEITIAGLSWQQIVESARTAVVENGQIVNGNKELGQWLKDNIKDYDTLIASIRTLNVETAKTPGQLPGFPPVQKQSGATNQVNVVSGLVGSKTVTVPNEDAARALNQLKQDEDAAAAETDVIMGKIDEFGTNLRFGFQTADQAVDQTKQKLTELTQTIEQVGDPAPINRIGGAFDTLQGGALNVGAAVGNLGTIGQSALATLQASANGIDFSGLIAQIQAAINKAQELAQALTTTGAGAPPAQTDTNGPAFAVGGLVNGPGTATSDSILARLSAGEFVQRTAAVRYYGPSFMSALNALRVPRELFRGFSLGGLVGGLRDRLSAFDIPRFATGGLAQVATAGGGALPHLGTVDLRTNHGSMRVFVDSNAVAQINTANVRSGMVRIGKPAR